MISLLRLPSNITYLPTRRTTKNFASLRDRAETAFYLRRFPELHIHLKNPVLFILHGEQKFFDQIWDIIESKGKKYGIEADEEDDVGIEADEEDDVGIEAEIYREYGFMKERRAKRRMEKKRREKKWRSRCLPLGVLAAATGRDGETANKAAVGVYYMNLLKMCEGTDVSFAIEAVSGLIGALNFCTPKSSSCIETMANEDKVGGVVAAQLPTNFGHELRACLRCRLMKTYDQFFESGCENCPFFKMEEDPERVADCTTPNFNGVISIMDTTRSWAARSLRTAWILIILTMMLSKKFQGLPNGQQNICEDQRVPYVPPKLSQAS